MTNEIIIGYTFMVLSVLIGQYFLMELFITLVVIATTSKVIWFMNCTCVKWYLLILLYFKTLGVSNYSCDISNKTVRIVKKCPEDEEKLREAATRMDCAAYANQCFEPERLVYHCVINTFVNQILEVCAYAQNILQGFSLESNYLFLLITTFYYFSCSSP